MMYRGMLITLAIVALLAGCDMLEPDEAEVRISILLFEQNYYESLGGWSDLVEVWYSINNTGNIDVDYYKIWFKATCSDGSVYEDWTNGLGLDTGHAMTDSTFINIPGKEVVNVKVTDYELTIWE